MANILVISDSAAMRNEITGTLTRRGFDTIPCDDGHKAGTLFKEHQPDLVISDSQVTSMGIMAITRELRMLEAEENLSRTPILAILDRRPDIFLARRADTDAWLVKPCNPAALRWTANTLLDPDKTWTEQNLEAELAGTLEKPTPPITPDEQTPSEEPAEAPA